MVAVLVAMLSFAGASSAATINYGNFGPSSGLTYTSVTESSITDALPLYGPPNITAGTLDFNPTSFGAYAPPSAADITDSQLNFTLMTSSPTVGITSLSLFEGGDYTLAGTGTAATGVSAGAIMRITIREINGVAVAPIVLAPVNASFSDTLPPSVIAVPWSLGLVVNIAAALPSGSLATKIDVVINNTLVATAEPATSAIIVKKDFILTPSTDVPEPASLALIGLGVLAVASRRRAS